MEDALKSVLDKANVPQRQHLMVIKALQRAMMAHAKDMQDYQVALGGHSDVMERVEGNMQRHEDHMQDHERQISEWDETSQHLKSITKGDVGESGEQGLPGRDAEVPDVNALVQMVMEKMYQPKDGDPGKDAVIDEDALLTKLLAKIKKGRMLKLSDIHDAQRFIKDGVSYKIEELMHGGGNKAGSGLKYLALVTGTIDNSNKVFTFASTPTIVVVNGASYINGSGVTITGTTATLDNAPGNGGSVYGLG